MCQTKLIISQSDTNFMNAQQENEIQIESVKFMENLHRISHEVFEKFNDYNLSVEQVKIAMEYMSNTILPSQIREYNKRVKLPPFRCVILAGDMAIGASTVTASEKRKYFCFYNDLIFGKNKDRCIPAHQPILVNRLLDEYGYCYLEVLSGETSYSSGYFVENITSCEEVIMNMIIKKYPRIV